jgi:methyl-accepting chemotaxis protein
LVEEASAAAQTLTEQAANLTEEIAKYRLDDQPAPAARPLAPPPVAAGATERRAANRPFRGKPAPAPAPQAGRAPQRAVGGADTWQEF